MSEPTERGQQMIERLVQIVKDHLAYAGILRPAVEKRVRLFVLPLILGWLKQAELRGRLLEHIESHNEILAGEISCTEDICLRRADLERRLRELEKMAMSTKPNPPGLHP